MTLKPPKSGSTLDQTYDEAFFRQHEAARPAYAHLAQLIREVSPDASQCVIDVGCGHCILLEELAKHFMTAEGVDGSTMGIPPTLANKVSVVDLSRQGWAQPMGKTFDVVVSLETAEHLPESSAAGFVESLISFSPALIVFSAATPYQDQGKNPSHINERPLGYWVEKFEERGYGLNPSLSMRMRASMTSSRLYAGVGWFLKNVLVFSPGQTEALSFSAQDFIFSSNPIFQTVFERDRLEFENLILKRIARLK